MAEEVRQHNDRRLEFVQKKEKEEDADEDQWEDEDKGMVDINQDGTRYRK